MSHTSTQDEHQKTRKIVAPVKLIIRALLTDEILSVGEHTLPTSLTDEEFSHLEARVKQEGISFDTAMVEFIENDLNNPENSKPILSDLSSRVGPVVVDVELTGTITFEPEA